jgi:hypothetical protein
MISWAALIPSPMKSPDCLTYNPYGLLVRYTKQLSISVTIRGEAKDAY